MRNLLNTGIGFGVLAVSLVIMAGLVAQTVFVVNNTTGGASALVSQTARYSGDAIITFTQYLPILALAILGGMAIAYVLGFLGSREA